MKKPLPSVPIKQSWIPFKGGLDTDTPAMSKSPGMVIGAQNFEQDVNGGYSSIEGYERFDGKAKPSDATYATLDCLITTAVNVGDVVTDTTGAIFGTVIAVTTP
jgi:hypothetical protein